MQHIWKTGIFFCVKIFHESIFWPPWSIFRFFFFFYKTLSLFYRISGNSFGTYWIRSEGQISRYEDDFIFLGIVLICSSQSLSTPSETERTDQHTSCLSPTYLPSYLPTFLPTCLPKCKTFDKYEACRSASRTLVFAQWRRQNQSCSRSWAGIKGKKFFYRVLNSSQHGSVAAIEGSVWKSSYLSSFSTCDVFLKLIYPTMFMGCVLASEHPRTLLWFVLFLTLEH